MDANSPPHTQFGLVVERTFRSEQFNGGVERGGDGERRGVELFAYVEWFRVSGWQFDFCSYSCCRCRHLSWCNERAALNSNIMQCNYSIASYIYINCY